MVAPGSTPIPLKVGVLSLVTPSVFDTPVSDFVSRLGADGVFAMVSIVTFSAVEALLDPPESVVCVADSVWMPSASSLAVIVQFPAAVATAVPSTVVPSLSCSVTVAPASAPTPAKTGVATLVMLSLSEAPLSLAAARSGVLRVTGMARPSEVMTPSVRSCSRSSPERGTMVSNEPSA